MFLLFTLRLIRHSSVVYQPKIIFACSIRQLKSRSKVIKLDRDHACLCTSGFGIIFYGTIYVVTDKSSGRTIYVDHNWSACMGRTRAIYVLPGPFMSMHKWSGRTNYDDISGPAGPSMLS